ncbi:MULTISPECIES: hypothetical protein [unclassified Meiothermus]|uniref:hypothetical protein n=1 Tax=unclassified Meiothermus TaxID=370471 RepID=UPI000D7BA1A1|nr:MULTISPECIES: hypothetical protein [unclassified Meiothermus]PZA06182.1 hypothetical protein DNA98_14550 [Meiothermus sp. Pnk-1]RYM37482.1 hypothetical protein EWH23_06170 [Meiothermus sp. PNK-Is4]
MIAWFLSLALNLPFLGGVQDYQILVALGCSAPRYVQNGYREMLAQEILPNLSAKLLNQRVRLTLAPITGRSYTAPARILETPDPLNTPRFKLEREKKGWKQEVLRAFDELRQQATAECTKGTEILAALEAAGERVRGPGYILVLVHGFEQSELVNLYDYRLRLERREVRQNLLERAKVRLGLPKLRGQEVCIAGITAGDDRNANARLTTSIKAFWEELIAASGGRLVGYGASPRVCPFL